MSKALVLGEARQRLALLVLLAARNLWRNRRRTMLALTALGIGTFMVVVLNGFRNGLSGLIVEGMVKAQVGAFQVHRAGFMDATDISPLQLSIDDTPDLRQRILAVPGVAEIAERLTFAGMASSGRLSTLIVGMGFNMAAEVKTFPLQSRWVAGRGLKDSRLPNAAVVGGPLMESLGLKQNDGLTITAQTPEGQTNATDVQLEGWLPEVDPFGGKRMLVVHLSYAQEFLRMHGRVTEYAVQVTDIDDIEGTAARVRAALGPAYEVHTWLEIMPAFDEIIRRLLFLLSAIAVVLAVIVMAGVVNVMAMSVYERVRETGTAMALGMRRRQILGLFLTEGTLLGIWGGAGGVALGLVVVRIAAAVGVPFKAPGSTGLMPLYPHVAWWFAALVVIAAALTALFAALVPAWRASRQHPADALRAL
jgi:putative ABC transport system permease protein